MKSTTSTVAGNPHEAHFLPGLAQTAAPFELNKALVSQLATFPIGSSSGGFTYAFDSKSRSFSRSSESFGPSFAERALTNGKGRFSAGFNFQHTSYDRFENTSLEQRQHQLLSCSTTTAARGSNQDGAPGGGSGDKNPAFEGDLVQVALSLKASSSTTAFFVNYGLTDRLDVGRDRADRPRQPRCVGSLDHRSHLDCGQSAHSQLGWPGRDRQDRDRGGQRDGHRRHAHSREVQLLPHRMAVAWRRGSICGCPTGDSKNLLGTGATQTRVLFIASGGFGRFCATREYRIHVLERQARPGRHRPDRAQRSAGAVLHDRPRGCDAVHHRFERAGRSQLHVRHGDPRALDVDDRSGFRRAHH